MSANGHLQPTRRSIPVPYGFAEARSSSESEPDVQIQSGVTPLVSTEGSTELAPLPPSGIEPRDAGPFRIGQVVGHAYEILCVLGVGGMNVVYEARDVALSRIVAIKAPLLSAYTPALRREAEALAAIRSAAFVSVFHVSREDDVEFIVMERLYGRTLEERLDELRTRDSFLPVSEVLDILVGVSEALADAHAAGIAHRDLKPANVILGSKRPVLIDLGLFVPEELVSADNDVAGSVRYMAPEVILRTVVPGQGPLIDLYALGILAFELLTNETPSARESNPRVLAHHVCAPVPDVSVLRRDVPASLATLLTDLLAKDPTERPADAKTVLRRLRAVAASIHAARTRRTATRHRRHLPHRGFRSALGRNFA